MRYKSLSLKDAYKVVKHARPIISPNLNFMGQLLELEENLIEAGNIQQAQTPMVTDHSEGLHSETSSTNSSANPSPSSSTSSTQFIIHSHSSISNSCSSSNSSYHPSPCNSNSTSPVPQE